MSKKTERGLRLQKEVEKIFIEIENYKAESKKLPDMCRDQRYCKNQLLSKGHHSQFCPNICPWYGFGEVEESSKENLSPRETIEKFIKDEGYTYKVEDILQEYETKYNKSYTSHTMTICCRELENEIKTLLKEKDGGADE